MSLLGMVNKFKHKGEIREMGTHQELLALRGIYYRLYLLQYKDQELERRERVAAG